jgi:muconolactone delta-isomerase
LVNQKSLAIFAKSRYKKKGIMDGTGTQRLSQKDKCHQDSIGGILEEVETFAQGVLKSVQEVAGTTNCKGVQIARIAEWANKHGYWIETAELGSYEDRGSENEVYMSLRGNVVYKLNDFRYSDDNLTPFFDRVKAHNDYFPDCAYTLVGFAKNKDNKVCAVLRQPYIISEREATEKEISDELARLGFMSRMNGEYFTNGIHDIFDASPNNVLVGIDGNFYFIDTIIYKSDEGNICTYHSQSPKFSK